MRKIDTTEHIEIAYRWESLRATIFRGWGWVVSADAAQELADFYLAQLTTRGVIGLASEEEK